MKKTAFLAAILSCTALSSTAQAQSRGAGDVASLIPRCTQNIGTAVVVEAQQDVFGHMDMAPPSEFLRYLIRESGCFTLIQRAPGATASAAPRVVEYALAANLTNEIKLGDGQTGMIGRNRATRWVADQGLQSVSGGLVTMDRFQEGVEMMHDGRMEAAMEAAVEVGVAVTGAVAVGAGAVMQETANVTEGYGRLQAQAGAGAAQNMEVAAATASTRLAGRGLQAAGRAMMAPTDPAARQQANAQMAAMGLEQPSMGQMVGSMVPGARLIGLGPRKSQDERLKDAIEELKKDIGKGKEQAQVEMSIVNIPLAEVVAESGHQAGKDQVRAARLPNNPFGTRAGRGWGSSDESKAISLAIISAYTDMVTDLGGMGSTTPAITLASREAISRAEEAKRQAEQAEAAARLPAARPASRPAARAAARPARSAAPKEAEVIRNAIMREAPGGRVVVQLAAGSTVYPTGDAEDGWRAIEDEAGNSGWVQEDRIMDLD